MRFNLSLHPIALTGNFLVTVIDLLIYPYWKNFQKKLVAKIEVPLFANVVYDSFLMHIPTSVWPHSTPCRIGHFSTKITAYRRLDNKPECEIWFKRMRQSTVVSDTLLQIVPVFLNQTLSKTPNYSNGFWQSLPLSVVLLKGKHCRKPHCCKVIVDMFGQRR